MKLTPEYISDFPAPFVLESQVKIGMKFVESLPLSNGCIFVIGSVEWLVIPDNAINDLGQLDLEVAESVGVSGLNTYYELSKIGTFPYVRNNEIPNFE